MSRIDELLKNCDINNQTYLKKYFQNAPEWILNSFWSINLSKGTAFIEEGERAEDVYILVKGKVLAVDYRVREIVYGYFEFHPIEVFGALEIMGNMEKYKTTLVTVEDSIFLKIKSKKFEKWLRNDANAFQMQTEKIGCYLVEQARKERLNVLLKATERIAIVLIRMYEMYADNGKSTMYLSRKDFMETTGLSERTVTRTLKEFETNGIITRSGWDIVLTKEQYFQLKELVDHKINKMGE